MPRPKKKPSELVHHDWEWAGITRNADQSHRADVWRCKKCGQYVNAKPEEEPTREKTCTGNWPLDLMWPGPQAREPRKRAK